MEKQNTNDKENIQSKVLLIRMWEILRRFGSDRPLSLDDIRQLLIEDDSARGIAHDPQKDKYNIRLLRTNIKAINAALERLPSEVIVPDKSERTELLKRKRKKAARANKQTGTDEKPHPDTSVEKITIGRGENKECLYYNSEAFTFDEIGFLYDAVSAQDCLTNECKTQMLDKISNLAGRPFKPWEIRMAKLPAIRYEISNVFDAIHMIECAIKNGKCLQFKYLIGWNVDKDYKWEPGMWQLQAVDPIAVYYRDGQYYLFGYNYPNVDGPPRSKLKDGYRTLRIDRMAKVHILDTPSEHADDRARVIKTWDKYRGRIPDFISWTGAAATEVIFRTSHKLVPELFEKFGPNLKIKRIREKSGQVLFKLDINDVDALFAWLVSCDGKVKIIKPVSVRDTFKAFLGKP